MSSKSIIAIVLSLAIVTLTGCASAGGQGGNPNYYDRSQVFAPGAVIEGTVTQSRSVRLKGSGMATTVGAGLGGLAGAALTYAKSNVVTFAVGAVGAAIGGFAASKMSETTGSEIVVQLVNNKTVVLVQESTDNVPAAGDRILLLINGKEARIVRKL